jgi:penicillin-binding protein 1A
MVAAHQGVEIKEIAGIGAGTKLPGPVASASVAGNGAQKAPDIKPGPPPVLTKRGADILVRVEKLLDDAAKTVGEPGKPVKPVSSNPAEFTDSFASAVPETPAVPAARKK